MKGKLNRLFTNKVRMILSLLIIVFGSIYLINYIFYTPSYINAYIASNVYNAPANSYFDDDNFYQCVVDNYNGYYMASVPYTYAITEEELSGMKYLFCGVDYSYSDGDSYDTGTLHSYGSDIVSTKGLEKMTGLTKLYLDNTKLTEIDVSNNTNLNTLSVSNGYLTGIDVSNNTVLSNLYLTNNQLTSLDVGNNIELGNLLVGDNKLSDLNISNNINLTSLEVYDNLLTSLDVSNNTSLFYLDISDNMLNELDVKNNTGLEFLYVENAGLTSLDVSYNNELIYLDVYGNELTSLNLNNNKSLTNLDVEDNKLINLDISNNDRLNDLVGSNNELVSLDVSNNINLTNLDVSNNLLSSLDVSKNTSLTSLNVSDNKLSDLVVSGATSLTSLDVNNNLLSSLDVSNTSLTKLDVSNNMLSYLVVSGATSLNYLDTSNNVLKELDISKNIKLEYLDYGDNLFSNVYVLVNNQSVFDNGLIIPDGWSTSLSTDDTSMFNIDSNMVTSMIMGKGIITQKIYDSNNKLVKLDYGVTRGTNYNVYSYNITSDKYEIDDDKIFTNKDSNDEILSNIIIDYGDTHEEDKVLTKEIIDNKLVIKYYDSIIKEYDLVNDSEYLDIGDYNIDEDNGIISRIPIDTSIDVFKGKIDINISYSIKDKNDNVITDSILKTGDKVVFDNGIIYNLSILGDVNGDGYTDISDVVKVVNHYTMNDKKLDGVYFLAGDIDNNNDLDISDVIKIVNYYVK